MRQSHNLIGGHSSIHLNCGGSEVDLAHCVPKQLALGCGDFELESGRAARAVSCSKRASSPRGASAHLTEVRELREGRRVSKRHEEDAVMGQGRDGVEDGCLCNSAS